MSLQKLLENTFLWAVSHSSIHTYYLTKFMGYCANEVEFSDVLVDIGSGKSPYKSFFHFDEYISFDISLNSKPMVLSDINFVPLKDSVADLVICTEVLEHVRTPKIAIDELYRILKDEKYLILTVPFLMGVHEKADFYRYTEMGLKDLLIKRGFKILRFEKRGGIFCSLYNLMAHIPSEITSYDRETNYIKFVIIFLYYIILMNFVKLFLVLDRIDKEKNYTLGYDVLIKKSEIAVWHPVARCGKSKASSHNDANRITDQFL